MDPLAPYSWACWVIWPTAGSVHLHISSGVVTLGTCSLTDASHIIIIIIIIRIIRIIILRRDNAMQAHSTSGPRYKVSVTHVVTVRKNNEKSEYITPWFSPKISKLHTNSYITVSLAHVSQLPLPRLVYSCKQRYSKNPDSTLAF